MNEPMLPSGLLKRVDAIAAAEGTSRRALVLTAVRELVKAYPAAPRRRVTPRTLAALEQSEDRCKRCEHPATGHDGPGACLVDRCVCREFYA